MVVTNVGCDFRVRKRIEDWREKERWTKNG